MARTLIRKNPSNFKTLPLHVEATPEGLIYQSIGMPLNFAQIQQRRKPIQLPDVQRFVVELANLGVSVRLTLHWQNRDYWVLVRQRRQDRGDVVLKLISGYVPAQELNLPLHTAVQEVAEECLLETPEGWLGGRFNDTWLPVPYAAALHYRETPHFVLAPESGAARPVHCGKLMLLERPRAYVHLPTASLQLIYDMRLQVPRDAKKLSLFHVDERLEGDQLVARLNRKRPDLYLMPLEEGQPLAELYTLKKDELVPASTRGLYLAESFARQEGWVVTDERVRWKDWVKQQGLVESKPVRASHLQRFGDKARELLERARTSLHK
ncbi:metal ABC transporter ATPase [Pseudomonas putida]|uniref:metal ABC transporter ATPase n=1 Tax=Pseudomonas putida TaxID=303 RepID=UPI002AC4C8DF|nr:metal ABC transporter ATPase [Pseudomonas putida]MDZ5109101.1 metal ABC transporter ATPase [Pseudomonas putida]